MNSTSHRFQFSIFGLAATCWIQTPGTPAYVGWYLERDLSPDRLYMLDYSDCNGNAWNEMSLPDFLNAFGPCESGDLLLSDFLPANA